MNLTCKFKWSMFGPQCVLSNRTMKMSGHHDDVIKWKHFQRYWPFVRGIHRSPMNSPHKGQWRRAFMFSLICAWINRGVNNHEAGDLRRYRAHYDVIVMCFIHDGGATCCLIRKYQLDISIPWRQAWECLINQTTKQTSHKYQILSLMQK